MSKEDKNSLKGVNQNPSENELQSSENTNGTTNPLAELSVQKLIELGGNLGDKRVHGSMSQYVYKKINNNPLINMDMTMRCIRTAGDFIKEKIEAGYQVVFIGRDAQFNPAIIEKHNLCKSFYLPKYWGGVLTNFETTKRCIEQDSKLSNDETLLMKNMKESYASQSTTAIQSRLEIIRKEKEKYKNYTGLQGLTNIHKTIFIGSSLISLSKLTIELIRVNSNLAFENWSYLISLADTNINISDMISPDNIDEFNKLQLKKPVIPIPSNPNKVMVVSIIFNELLLYIKEAQIKLSVQK
jgi:ribosomal protein S2